MRLAEALSLGPREVISLVGGGGKTSLLFALGKELCACRRGVILTTTTKILEPGPSAFGFFLSPDFSAMSDWILGNLEKRPYLLLARERLAGGKLLGVPSPWVERLHSLPGVSTIIVEADGAAGRSLKAHREDEPVIPPDTSLLVPVTGIDVLGRPLEEPWVFRTHLAARFSGAEIGCPVTEETVVRLFCRMVRGRPAQSRLIPFLNKTDLPGALEKGRRLAGRLLDLASLPIQRVVLGQARDPSPVTEIRSKPLL